MPVLEITRAKVLVQRFFDTAYEVQLDKALNLILDAHMVRAPVAGRGSSLSPPLEIFLPKTSSGIAGLDACDVTVHVYDLGIVVITFVVELPSTATPDSMIELAGRIWDAEQAITQAARPLADQIMKKITSACVFAETAGAFEDFTQFFIQSTNPDVDAGELQQHLDIARLLLGERHPLAETERKELTQESFRYRPNDLVVIDWNGALVFDPSGAFEAAYYIEMASVQLVELRNYDTLITRSLARYYDELEPSRMSLLSASRYQQLSRSIMRTMLNVSTARGRVSNSLQITLDSWLARIHHAAVVRLDLPRWERQIDDKLRVLRDINNLLLEQINTSRALRLELAIVVLILLELMLTLLRLT